MDEACIVRFVHSSIIMPANDSSSECNRRQRHNGSFESKLSAIADCKLKLFCFGNCIAAEVQRPRVNNRSVWLDVLFQRNVSGYLVALNLTSTYGSVV